MKKRVLSKTLAQWMPSDCSGVSCFQQIFEENLEFTSEVWNLLQLSMMNIVCRQSSLISVTILDSAS